MLFSEAPPKCPRNLERVGLKEHSHASGVYLLLGCPKPPQRAEHEDLESTYDRRSVAWSGGSAELVLCPDALTGGEEGTLLSLPSYRFTL